MDGRGWRDVGESQSVVPGKKKACTEGGDEIVWRAFVILAHLI